MKPASPSELAAVRGAPHVTPGPGAIVGETSAPTAFALGAEVRVRKSREVGHIIGQAGLNGRVFHEVQTGQGIHWPLIDHDLEAV